MTKKKFFNKDLLFYIVMLAFPVLQFSLFYIGVNGRSYLYSFQDITTDGVSWSTKNLVRAFETLTSKTYMQYLGTSFLAFALTYFIGTVLALFFSYFIYKKLPMGGFFKVFLFLPSILSSIVIGVIFLYFVENALPGMVKSWFGSTMQGLFRNTSTRFATVIFYNIFIGFGTSVLMYSNAMSGISTDIIEAGKLDGASSFREFFSIVIPSIFPTITTFAITSVAAIFVNQLSLFSLFGMQAEENVKTIGYSLYIQTVNSKNNEMDYPYLSAIGFCLTLVAVPLTFGVKYLLEKFGPSDK